MNIPSSSPCAAGIGFRSPHACAIAATRPAVGFLEVHAENYMAGGPAGRQLDRLRENWPISIHGVGLSLGSAGGLDAAHLDRFVALVERIEPMLVSEHLAWSGVPGTYLNDLLPLPLTEETLALVADNVARLQDRIGRAILVENPSAYLRFAHSTIAEPEFLAELARRTGCGVLLDVNNVYVSAANLAFDATAWLAALALYLPAEAVGEIHLAGHSINDADGVSIHIDDHGSRVSEPVWALHADAVRRFPRAPALVEWDSDLPALDVLLDEAAEADRRRAAALALISGHDRENGNAVAA